MPQFLLHLPEDQRSFLLRIKQDQGISASELVRRLITLSERRRDVLCDLFPVHLSGVISTANYS